MNANARPAARQSHQRSAHNRLAHDQLKCILVGLQATEQFTATPALIFAIDVARRHGATLVLHVFAPALAQPVAGAGASPLVWAKRETEGLVELTSATVRSASELISAADVDFVAEHAASPFEPRNGRFLALARTNDVTVLDAALSSDTEQRTLIEDVLFDSGRAVLLVPRHGGKPSPCRIAIAWDGSARSARAVKDALPLLIAAGTVIAVTVAGEKDLSRMAPGADLAMYLARHGVADCKLATLAAAGSNVGQRLALFVAEEEIEMIVMGAFVHSRFREAVLGGVTRSLLDDAPVALFMSH